MIALLILAGCSGGMGDRTAVQPAGDTPRSSTSHGCWGMWQLNADPAAGTLEIVPLRASEMHLNALVFLEPPPFVNLTLESLQFNGNIVEADIGLKHPFLGLNEFTGFDVCGIFISNGSKSGFGDSKLRIATDGDTRLLNPDGYSRWWNPTEFPVNNGTMLGYKDGLLGTPDSKGNFSSTINGYKYFCNQLEPNDDLNVVGPLSRGVFSAGSKHIRHYSIDMGPGLVFNYAVDACWLFPQGQAPWTVPDDFPPGANRPEAWRIDVNEISNSLYNDGSTSGGELHLGVDVYDWFHADLNSVKVESPGNFNAVTVTAPTGGGEGYSTYVVDITSASPAASGPMDILMSVACEQDGFQGFIQGVKTTAYYVHTTEVDNSQECPIPVPKAITGSPHIANGSVDTTITCTNLWGTSGIEAYLDLDGTIDGSYDIIGTNISNVDLADETFDATFDLTGVTPGYYYVIVKNSCGKTGASATPLFQVTEYLVGDIYVSNHVDFDSQPEQGTMEHPYHTVKAGANAAGTGDLVLVDYGRGTYPEAFWISPSNFTLRAYNWYSPSGRPTIGGPDTVTTEASIIYFSGSNITMQGFKMAFSECNANSDFRLMFLIFVDGVTFKDMYFTGTAHGEWEGDATCADMVGATNITFTNCLIKKMNGSQVTNNNDSIDIRLVNAIMCSNITVEKCEITELQYTPVNANQGAYIEPIVFLQDYGGFNVHNNLIHHISLSSASTWQTNNVRFILNWGMLSSGSGQGIIANNTIDTASIEDCTGGGASYLCGIDNEVSEWENVDIYNNIVTNLQSLSTQDLYGIQDAGKSDYCNIWHTLEGDIEVPWYDPSNEGDGCTYLDPMFVDNEDAPYDYHLAPGSPCIGSGKDGEDMGCYGNLAYGDVIGLLGPED